VWSCLNERWGALRSNPDHPRTLTGRLIAALAVSLVFGDLFWVFSGVLRGGGRGVWLGGGGRRAGGGGGRLWGGGFVVLGVGVRSWFGAGGGGGGGVRGWGMATKVREHPLRSARRKRNCSTWTHGSWRRSQRGVRARGVSGFYLAKSCWRAASHHLATIFRVVINTRLVDISNFSFVLVRDDFSCSVLIRDYCHGQRGQPPVRNRTKPATIVTWASNRKGAHRFPHWWDA